MIVGIIFTIFWIILVVIGMKTCKYVDEGPIDSYKLEGFINTLEKGYRIGIPLRYIEHVMNGCREKGFQVVLTGNKHFIRIDNS
jgi:hypothetical protein